MRLNQSQIIQGALVTSFLFAVALSGCVTSRAVSQKEESQALLEKNSNEAPSYTHGDSKVLVEEILSADAEIEPEPHSEVPMEMNGNVQKWIDYFSLKDRNRFSQFLERGFRYKELVQSILREHGVPQEMYYLAMIESGYVTYARSRARAVGAWQFMPATGRRYGLKTNFYLDERQDIVRSTRAAARYLKDLHSEFGSWYLAMASYNAGEGRIRRAIRKGKTRDFWILVKRRVLPRETMNYVPKFLAAVIIGKNLEKYGFEKIPEKKFPLLKAVAIPASIQLSEVAKASRLSLDELKDYNSHLIREVTPQNVSSYEIWIPEALASQVESVAQSLPRFTGNLRSLRGRNYAALQEKSGSTLRFHRVQRGETLISIAQRYRVGVPVLKKLNRLKTSRIYVGQSLKVAPKWL